MTSFIIKLINKMSTKSSKTGESVLNDVPLGSTTQSIQWKDVINAVMTSSNLKKNKKTETKINEPIGVLIALKIKQFRLFTVVIDTSMKHGKQPQINRKLIH